MNKNAAIAGGAALLIAAAGLFFLLRGLPAPEPNLVPIPPRTANVPPPPPVETRDPIPPRVPSPEKPPVTAPKTATIYRVDASGERARLVPVTILIPVGGEPMASALNAMAALEESPLPPGTRARSVAAMGNGVVHVDFNDAFQKNFPGGDEEEALTLGAVTGTLAHFFGVERVQITVNGKKIDSLGGNQSLREPLPVRETQAARGAAP